MEKEALRKGIPVLIYQISANTDFYGILIRL